MQGISFSLCKRLGQERGAVVTTYLQMSLVVAFVISYCKTFFNFNLRHKNNMLRSREDKQVFPPPGSWEQELLHKVQVTRKTGEYLRWINRTEGFPQEGCQLSYRDAKQYLPSKLNFGGKLGPNQWKPRHHLAPRMDLSPVTKKVTITTIVCITISWSYRSLS